MPDARYLMPDARYLMSDAWRRPVVDLVKSERNMLCHQTKVAIPREQLQVILNHMLRDDQVWNTDSIDTIL